MQHILQQIDETTSNQEPENWHSVIRYHKVVVAKQKKLRLQYNEFAILY